MILETTRASFQLAKNKDQLKAASTLKAYLDAALVLLLVSPPSPSQDCSGITSDDDEWDRTTRARLMERVKLQRHCVASSPTDKMRS